MDVNLENLIEKLRKEGVDDARKQADEIVKKAGREADAIVDKAKRDAEKILHDARQKTDQYQKNSELAIQQAARDSIRQLKGKISSLFDDIFKKKVSDVMKPEDLKKLILKIIEQWSKDKVVEVSVSQTDLKQLETLLFSGIKDKLKEIVTIKPSRDISEGFRIGVKGDDIYYDFSSETIAEMLRQFLNPRLQKMLDSSNG